jgi:ABC-type Na+ efflux pump permease subunit
VSGGAVAVPLRHRAFSLGRVWTLARGTLTQLIRMKVFAFMAIFAVLLIGASFAFADLKSEQELKMLKDVSFAAMQLFCMLFAVAGTALLIPRDVEDRTIYTILCKPVSRLEYLLGKFVGMVLVLVISLAAMDVLFTAVLHLKQNAVIGQNIAELEFRRFANQEDREKAAAEIVNLITTQGVGWNLQAGVVAILAKSVVLTAVTLLMSTFATSTLFTIMSSLAMLVIGHAQALARDVLLGESGGGVLPRLVAGAVAIIFPDFKTFDVLDAVITGVMIPGVEVLKMGGLAVVYCVIYLLAAWILFAEKEL